MSTPTPTPPPTGSPGIAQQVRADIAKDAASLTGVAKSFEQKQAGWLRLNAAPLLIGFAVGAIASGVIAHALHL